VYGTHILQQHRGPDGRPLGDHVEWVAGGGSATMLSGLKAGKFDAIMAVPEWMWAAESQGFGKAIYDVLDEGAWNRVFGGPLPVTVGYCLKETIEKQPAIVQGYVNACFRAQQWIRTAPDDEILDLLHQPYMDAFSRDEVLRSIRYYKGILDWDFRVDEAQYAEVLKIFLSTKVLDAPIPFPQAVDMSFARKASQRS
jgi:NitT/TauT family transport system substrate-binding protein